MSKEKVNPFAIYFSLNNGLSDNKESISRYLSDMEGMYYDNNAYNLIKDQNPKIYDFYDLKIPKTDGDLAFGTSIVYPGKIGNEYYMTKGHFHTILDTAEVYYCIGGLGYMLMETPEGKWDIQKMNPGRAVYVPKRYSHRSINIGREPLITFYTFRADAGHDYGTIEKKGFRKLVIEKEGKPDIIDNPKWKDCEE